MLAGRLLRRRLQRQQVDGWPRRRRLYLAPPFLVEDYEPAAVTTARREGAMAAKLDQGAGIFLHWFDFKTLIWATLGLFRSSHPPFKFLQSASSHELDNIFDKDSGDTVA